MNIINYQEKDKLSLANIKRKSANPDQEKLWAKETEIRNCLTCTVVQILEQRKSPENVAGRTGGGDFQATTGGPPVEIIEFLIFSINANC